jgi:hypothetical protein
VELRSELAQCSGIVLSSTLTASKTIVPINNPVRSDCQEVARFDVRASSMQPNVGGLAQLAEIRRLTARVNLTVKFHALHT